MLYRCIKKLSDGSYHVFLMGKDLHQVNDPEDVLYQVIIRDIQSINNIFDVQIRLKLARKLFKLPESTPEELDGTLIVYDKNKNAFHLMIDCLYKKGEEDFSLDFNKFKVKMNDLGNIVMSQRSNEFEVVDTTYQEDESMVIQANNPNPKPDRVLTEQEKRANAVTKI